MRANTEIEGMLLDFTNKVVVITGAGGGLGRAMVQSFCDRGARVVGVDLRTPEEPVAGCRYMKVDVSDFTAVADCIKGVLDTEKDIDVLVNNAGISRDRAIWRMTETEWDSVLGVNLKGAFNFIHHCAPHFRQRNGGKIVNVSSINGLRGKFGLANYAASKAGLVGLTKTVAKELGRHHVNVNAIAPGLVLTPLTKGLPPDIIDASTSETALGRLALPEDVANVVLFLCSSLARHITGEVIKVDGGQYI